MDNKAQASLEYLILVAAIIAIVAIIAFWLKTNVATQSKAIQP